MINFKFTLLYSSPFSTISLTILDDSQTEHVINTPLKICPDLWDFEKQRPHNIYLKKNKNLNAKLDRLKIGIAEYLSNVTAKNSKISHIKLRKIIKENCDGTKSCRPANSLLDYVEAYIRSRAHLISEPTSKRYRVFLHLLERFEGHRKRHLLLHEVNASFVKEFLEFGELEEYNKSTIGRTIHFVRTVLNFLEKRGVRTYVYELELPKEKKVNLFVTLSEDELVKLKETDVPPRLQAARDWLIISCYTGQRISDFMNFDIKNLEIIKGKPCISFVQQKTQKEILLPLHPVPLTILSANLNVFPQKLTAQKYNLQIKEVAELAGINSLVKVRKRKGFRAIEMFVQKWEAITSHIGRRSFASNFYGKIPTPLLMEATGHSTEQMFHRYISTIDTERTRTLGQYLEDAYNEKFRVA